MERNKVKQKPSRQNWRKSHFYYFTKTKKTIVRGSFTLHLHRKPCIYRREKFKKYMSHAMVIIYCCCTSYISVCVCEKRRLANHIFYLFVYSHSIEEKQRIWDGTKYQVHICNQQFFTFYSIFSQCWFHSFYACFFLSYTNYQRFLFYIISARLFVHTVLCEKHKESV